MRTRTILATLAVFVAGAALSLAADVNMGTWKLNDGKSKIASGSPKNTTVIYAAMGDGVKVTVDGVDKDGKPTHNEWTGKFDGKEYAVAGDPASDMRSYTKVDEHTTKIEVKKGGKTTITGNLVVAADGKSRTLTTTSTDAAGKAVTNTFVYDKQ